MRAARRVREGARGKRPVATPAPRPRAYLTTALREAKAALQRRRAVGRADAPLRHPGPGPAGTRRLGRRRRDDPRRRPRRRPRRGPRQERAPRRAARPAPRDLPPRARRAVITAIRPGHASCTAADQRNREIPDRHRPEPAPRPQGQVPAAHSPAPAATPPPAPPQPSSPSATRPPDQHKHQPRTREPPAGPWNRPSPGTTRRPQACPPPAATHRNQKPGTARTRNTQMPKPHGIGRAPAPHLAIRSPGITRRRRNKIGRMLIWLSLQAVAGRPTMSL